MVDNVDRNELIQAGAAGVQAILGRNAWRALELLLHLQNSHRAVSAMRVDIEVQAQEVNLARAVSGRFLPFSSALSVSPVVWACGRYDTFIDQGFIHLACIMICFRRFGHLLSSARNSSVPPLHVPGRKHGYRRGNCLPPEHRAVRTV